MRSDLIKTFHALFTDPKLSQLNWVVIETTGLADPAPLIQSLYMDAKCKQHLRMDCVLTVVDVKHIEMHIERAAAGEVGIHGGSMEAIQQICFADRIILNKTDLVDRDHVDQVEDVVKRTNPSATVIRSVFSNVPVEDLLNVRAFDASRNMSLLEKCTPDNSIPVFIKTDKDGKILRNSFASKNRRDSSKMTNIATISLTTTNPIDLEKFNIWITQFLQQNGANLFRVKGNPYVTMSLLRCAIPASFAHMVHHRFRHIEYERLRRPVRCARGAHDIRRTCRPEVGRGRRTKEEQASVYWAGAIKRPFK